MTETKKTTARKANNTPAEKASNAMNKGDLTAIVTGLLLTKGGVPTAAAIETAKYIVEQCHESA